MQFRSIRVLVVRAHLLEMIISAAFIVLAVFLWLSTGRSDSDVSLFAGAALLVAGAMMFLFAMKSILKNSRIVNEMPKLGFLTKGGSHTQN